MLHLLPRSTRYSIPRSLRGLRRNWRWALNSVLIVTSAISVLGMIVLLYINVQHAAQFWLSNSSISLFLTPGLSTQQQGEVLTLVRTHPLVSEARLISPNEGLASLAHRLGAGESLFNAEDADSLPFTIDFEVYVDYRNRIESVAEFFRKIPAVQDVVYAERMLEKVDLFFVITQIVGLFFIGLMLISFCLIIANAIKLSMHARLEEIEILSLIGATRAFIRIAFVLEGVIISVVGGALALVLIWMAYELLMAGLTWDLFTRGLREISIFFSWRALAGALAVIMVLGGLSSHISVTRVLRSLKP